jgi:hypothetical protein
MQTLVLTLGSSVAVLKEFASGNGYDRTTAETGDVEYSLNGTPIADGHLYEPKWVWTVSAYTEEATALTIERIFRRSERYRAAEISFGILLADYVKPCTEDAPQSRQLAPGGSIVSTDDELIYPAVYSVRMFQPKVLPTGNGHTWLVSFVLKELDRVAP